jgi:hypothetical protein
MAEDDKDTDYIDKATSEDEDEDFSSEEDEDDEEDERPKKRRKKSKTFSTKDFIEEEAEETEDEKEEAGGEGKNHPFFFDFCSLKFSLINLIYYFFIDRQIFSFSCSHFFVNDLFFCRSPENNVLS